MPVNDLYTLGRVTTKMPIPLIAEHCTAIPAGPVRFVIEGRDRVPDAALLNHELPSGDEEIKALDDGGPSVHVFDADGQTEYLRFDCFENEPHYHYLDHAAQRNLIVRIDPHAEGDPVSWALERLRSHLPEMLRFTGADALADQVAEDHQRVRDAAVGIAEILEANRAAVRMARAARERSHSSGESPARS
jgi:hypothetical protein